MFMNLFGKFSGIEKEKLERYQYSSGGDMLGSSYSESVQEYGKDNALVTFKRRGQHNDDGTVKEYLVDKEILNELKAVFAKYRMKNWHNKQFTTMSVADGASYSYSFDFETDRVSFSSQYYPEKYSYKLRELDEILDRYVKNAALLPGLRIHDSARKTDYTPPYDLNNGEIVLSVYSYYEDYLCFRLANGTDEEMITEAVIRLYKDGESAPLCEKSSGHKTTLYAHRSNENSVRLKERLTPGKYRLEAFGETAEFEIG